jgi:hypothetical protein
LSRGVWLVWLLLGPIAGAAQEHSIRLPDGTIAAYRVVGEGEQSAQPVALQVLTHLAAGHIDDAAQLSNEPSRRAEVLRDYVALVGEPEFRRVFAQYLAPENRVVAEIAMGPRRLIIWDLESAGHRLAGQYYIEVEGKFLMDDRPGPERLALQRVLAEHRKKPQR